MSDNTPVAAQTADVRQIKDWLDRNEIVLVDGRETSEFEVEHSAGAVAAPVQL